MEAAVKAFVVGGLCLLSGLLAVGGLTISSLPFSTVLKPGSNTTLECTVSGKGFNSFFNQIVWYKYVTDDVDIQLNTGGIINFPFRDTGRFAVNPEMIFEKDEVVMPLSVTDVTVADDGTYVCQLFGQEGIMDNINYTVRVPEAINNLTLSTNATGIDINGTLVAYVFEEKQPTHVFCSTVGGNPAPTLRMYLGKVDITTEFTRKLKATRVGEKGLEVITYVVEIATREFRAHMLHNGEALTCVAEMWEVVPLTKSVSVAIKVLYAPKFFCKTVIPSAFYTVSYPLRCKIQANPRADLSNIFWMVGGANGTNITVGESKDGFTVNATVDETDELTINTDLAISVVNSTSYQQQFDLYASNNLGQRHHQIVLCEVTEAPNTTILTNTTQVNTTQVSLTTKTPPTEKYTSTTQVHTTQVSLTTKTPPTEKSTEKTVPEKMPLKPVPSSVDQITITIATNIVIAIATMFLFGIINI